MQIADFDTNDRVLVVAEIGNNHEGSLSLAEDLIGRAAAAGADAVKFQTFRTERFISRRDEARFNRLKSFELTFPQFEKLAATARRAGLIFFSTPLDLESAKFLDSICPVLKIASGDNNFDPLLDAVARTAKPLILSTGCSDLNRIGYAKTLVERAWSEMNIAPGLALLHCVSAYPAPLDQVNLRALAHLKECFDCTIGYSDHTLGIESAVAAVALGARIIEKHFTINKNYSDFRDHQLSADSDDLAELVRRTRQVEVMLGNGNKIVQPSEQPVAAVVQRSIVAVGDLPAGRAVCWNDLAWVRCPDGLRPGQENSILGRSLKEPVREGEALREDLFEPLS